ncbi:MAG: TrbG/VirB9 family P-type conjugative transfer protein [Treponema sp.]|nr:TrbG/VirB9 family P-type conjugative transfer protein [Treponema sp.]MBR0099989.1 TrbG/VirB9 family P-type conjugative transfer protein [Treponema sp.]
MAVLAITVFFFMACNTTKDMEAMYEEETKAEAEATDAKSEEEEEQLNEAEMKGIFVQEEAKVQDVENTVVFVDRPVYIPQEKSDPKTERGNKTGYDAVVESEKRATVQPELYNKGTFYYQYNENLVYEVYAQPYHLTDIILEKGEIVTGTPLLSEDEAVWELTAGVSKDPLSGEDIQHLFIKPAYSKQDSSLIIITDRRVYHFRIKSFASTYMAMVRFTYPNVRNQWAKKKVDAAVEIENDFIRVSNPEFLSFDYKMKYSMWRKPEFLPKRVYDDGQTTYIQVDDIVLQKKLPVIFNEKNEIVNYSVKKNVFIIPRLINMVTLRLGKEKVTITKKKTGAKKAAEIEEESQKQSGAGDGK